MRLPTSPTLRKLLVVICYRKEGETMRKTVRYKKGDIVGRKLKEATLLRGWKIVEEKETGGFSAGKGFLLGLIFLPLALFGFGTYVEVTYEKQ